VPIDQQKYPWSETSPIKGNLSVGNLRNNIRKLLTNSGRIHVETLLTGAGAIAGFCSQNAFWYTTKLTPDTVPETGFGAELAVVRTKSGERFFFGDQLNAYIAGRAGSINKFYLWAFVRGALVSLGLPPDQHPDLGQMFSNVSKAVGTEGFGLPVVEDLHLPHASAPQLIRVLWPHVQAIFALPPPPQMKIMEPDLEPSYWPSVSFLVANQLMISTRGYVPPAVAATLVIESAIAASKLDPKQVLPA